MCDEYIDYLVGEKSEIEGYVSPKKMGEVVVITHASYEVTKEYDDEIIFSGQCEVEKDHFRTLLTFEEAGNYIFTVTLHIGEEMPKEKVFIRVNS
jgi:hypothetical protein